MARPVPMGEPIVIKSYRRLTAWDIIALGFKYLSIVLFLVGIGIIIGMVIASQ